MTFEEQAKLLNVLTLPELVEAIKEPGYRSNTYKDLKDCHGATISQGSVGIRDPNGTEYLITPYTDLVESYDGYGSSSVKWIPKIAYTIHMVHGLLRTEYEGQLLAHTWPKPILSIEIVK